MAKPHLSFVAGWWHVNPQPRPYHKTRALWEPAHAYALRMNWTPEAMAYRDRLQSAKVAAWVRDRDEAARAICKDVNNVVILTAPSTEEPHDQTK